MKIDPEILRTNPAFAKTDQGLLLEALEGAKLLELEPHHEFISAGDSPEGVFILCEGETRVFHRNQEKREVTVKHLGAPCTLGEMQVLAGMTFVENAETMTAAKLVWIEAERFKNLLHADPPATYELLVDVCTRFCVAASNEAVILFDVSVRLASLLLAFADLYGRDTPQGRQIRYELTHANLADGLGVTRKSINRTMADWKKKELVIVHKGWLVITDVPQLEKLCGGLRFNINYRAGVEADPTRRSQKK